MKISHVELKVSEVLAGYSDDGEAGVSAFNGTLDIRPPYQREFVYKDSQRDAVIRTILRGHPLNVMYFALREDGSYEVMDGQQRLISIGQYLNGDYSIDERSFNNLPSDVQDVISNYSLFIYICDGLPSEKLDWFRVINIAGQKLTNQEMRNAVYHGPFVSDAKRWFSKTGGPAAALGDGYISGTPNRQELLELAIKWACYKFQFESIDGYMDSRRSEPNASELWAHYSTVLTWAQACFPVKRPPMKSVNWGEIYSRYGEQFPDATALEERVKSLILDDDVQNKAGIYSYVFDGDVTHLNIRQFTDNQRLKQYEKQEGLCANSKYSGHSADIKFSLNDMEADHIKPWSDGGATIDKNCQMLCKDCNRRKGAK